MTLRGTARGKTTVWLLMLLMLLMLLLPLLVWRPVGTLLWVGRGWRGTVVVVSRHYQKFTVGIFVLFDKLIKNERQEFSFEERREGFV